MIKFKCFQVKLNLIVNAKNKCNKIDAFPIMSYTFNFCVLQWTYKASIIIYFK